MDKGFWEVSLWFLLLFISVLTKNQLKDQPEDQIKSRTKGRGTNLVFFNLFFIHSYLLFSDCVR